MPLSMQDFSSSTREGTVSPAVGVQSHNHWTTREFPSRLFLVNNVVLEWTSLRVTFLHHSGHWIDF